MPYAYISGSACCQVDAVQGVGIVVASSPFTRLQAYRAIVWSILDLVDEVRTRLDNVDPIVANRLKENFAIALIEAADISFT